MHFVHLQIGFFGSPASVSSEVARNGAIRGQQSWSGRGAPRQTTPHFTKRTVFLGCHLGRRAIPPTNIQHNSLIKLSRDYQVLKPCGITISPRSPCQRFSNDQPWTCSKELRGPGVVHNRSAPQDGAISEDMDAAKAEAAERSSTSHPAAGLLVGAVGMPGIIRNSNQKANSVSNTCSRLGPGCQ